MICLDVCGNFLPFSLWMTNTKLVFHIIIYGLVYISFFPCNGYIININILIKNDVSTEYAA